MFNTRLIHFFKQKFSIVFMGVFIFIFGAGAGILAYKITPVEKSKCLDNYEFIDPERGCKILEQDNISNISIITNTTKDYINNEIQNNNVIKVSVFFRDLVTKRWSGINENDEYKAGSLLKLPLLIAFYKISEIDDSIFSKEFKYLGNNESGKLEDIKPGALLEKGKIYSIKALLDKIIIDSDNDAAMFLFDKLDPSLRDKIYTDLQIYNPTSKGIDKSYVSAKNYANLIRILYSASYLTLESSNKILELLTKTTFNDGLIAGVPAGIMVAHKFGDRTYLDENNQVISRTLNDCGIIYAPKHPYILCVATQGYDFNKLKNIIKNISKIIYGKMTD